MYVQSEQALLNTSEVTQQQCSVSFGWQPTIYLTSPVDLLGVAGGRDAGTSGAEAGPQRSAQMMGQQQQQQQK